MARGAATPPGVSLGPRLLNFTFDPSNNLSIQPFDDACDVVVLFFYIYLHFADIQSFLALSYFSTITFLSSLLRHLN